MGYDIVVGRNESDKKDFKECPNDADVQETLDKYKKEGLMADVVAESVLAFMQASPETFMDHLTLYAVQAMMNETGS